MVELLRDFTQSDSDSDNKITAINDLTFQQERPLALNLLRFGQGQGARPAARSGGRQHLRGHAPEAGQSDLRGLAEEGQETRQPQPWPGPEVSLGQEGGGHQHQQAAHPAHAQVTCLLFLSC